MKTNEELQNDVQNAIKWEPLLHAAEIGVSAKNGVVTLSGIVDSYAKKLEVERATRKVYGVKAIAENIKVEFSNTWKKNDTEVATGISNALKWRLDTPYDKIMIKVENGWVTLEGELAWNYQKTSAEKTIQNLIGVKGITNNIVVTPDMNDNVDKRSIELSILRNWFIYGEDIKVDVTNKVVTLTGAVKSLFHKEEAERLAWNAPGVSRVKNELVVEYDF